MLAASIFTVYCVSQSYYLCHNLPNNHDDFEGLKWQNCLQTDDGRPGRNPLLDRHEMPHDQQCCKYSNDSYDDDRHQILFRASTAPKSQRCAVSFAAHGTVWKHTVISDESTRVSAPDAYFCASCCGRYIHKNSPVGCVCCVDHANGFIGTLCVHSVNSTDTQGIVMREAEQHV